MYKYVLTVIPGALKERRGLHPPWSSPDQNSSDDVAASYT